jgi:hypothetical protein
MDSYSASAMKQQSADRHVAPLEHIILIRGPTYFPLGGGIRLHDVLPLPIIDPIYLYFRITNNNQVRVITIFTVFRLLTDFVCLYTYEF